MNLAKRRFKVDSSGIRKVFDLAANMENPINLTIGQPDYDVPESIKAAAVRAIEGGQNRYTLSGGVPALRAAVKARYAKRGINFEDVMISSGTSGALVLLFLVLLDPGDEMIAADPYFVMYKHLVSMVGATPVFADSYPDFRLTRARLEKVVTEKTKVLVVNSPSNPTGIVYTDAECRDIAAFAKEHDLWMISDEIYEPFCYDADFVSPAKYYDKSILISGLSKTVGMTGWRLGWMCGPAEVVKAAVDFQQYTFVCAPSMVQEAALQAVEWDMSTIAADYRGRRDIIYNGLVDAGYEVEKPGGAFYIFPKAPNGDGQAFVQEAIKRKLLMVPGNVFSERNTHFRISFATSPETLRAGLAVLEELAQTMGHPA